MLVVIRADALERCWQAGEGWTVHLDRHAQWYFARMVEIDWLGARMEVGLAHARGPTDNVRAALSRLIALGDTQRRELMLALHYFWEYDGYQSEGQNWPGSRPSHCPGRPRHSCAPLCAFRWQYLGLSAG